MARKTKTVTITSPGRDQGKSYILTEMPATKAEKWAARAFLALAKAGLDVPEEAAASGVAGFAAMGLDAIGKLNWEDAEPLLDEMMSCVQVQPSPGITRPLVEAADDIEEVMTLLTLRKELLELHLGFSLAAAPSTSATAAAAEND